MQTLWQDFKHAARLLRNRPGFSAAAILSLALGAGACTSIFSVVNGVLLRPLPYPQPERIVQLRELDENGKRMPVCEPNFLDLRARNRTLEAVAQYSGWLQAVTGGSEPVRTRTTLVSKDFFQVMGVQPLAGQTSIAADEKNGEALAVVSYGFWKRLLGGRTDLNAERLKIDDRSFSIAGVMPQGFAFPNATEVWISRELDPPQKSRSAHNWSVVARLRLDVSLEAARSDASAIGRQIKEENGKDVDAVDLALMPLQEAMVGKVRGGLLILLAAVGFLLLVACANVANLLLAQVTARQKEFAVRMALGASRLRLVQQMIVENMVLTLIAAGLGTLLAFWGVDLLLSLNPAGLPRSAEVRVDAAALGFTLALSVVVAVLLALVPAMRFSGGDLQPSLKESSRGSSAHAASNRLRSGFVVLQMALTLVLLIGAGLLGKSFLKLMQVDPGFQPEGAVVMELSLPSAKDAEANRRLALFHEQLLDRVGQIPGVVAVGGINSLPMTEFGGNGTFLINNDRTRTGYAEYRQASEGYFGVMGIPLLRGRLFQREDGPDSPHVAVISKSLADKVWPDEDPIGQRIQFGNMDGDIRLLNVVGIVGDVRDYGLDADVRPAVYAYSLQRPQSMFLSIVARPGRAGVPPASDQAQNGEPSRTSASSQPRATSSSVPPASDRPSGSAGVSPASLIPAMRSIVQSMDNQIPIDFKPLEQIFSSSLDSRRFSLVIFGVFAAVALLLAAMGIYSVMSYTMSQRTQEFGIRIALGARKTDILGLTMGQGLKLMLVGVALGGIGAVALTRLLESLLFGVSATDPLTFVAIGLLLSAIALLACYVPARRAAKVDPMVALRYE
ncbi:MAG: ADOP family duplicated permease [Acidobacteriota bacterium]